MNNNAKLQSLPNEELTFFHSFQSLPSRLSQNDRLSTQNQVFLSLPDGDLYLSLKIFWNLFLSC